MANDVYRARIIELGVFFFILAVGTLAILVLTVQFTTLAPPHAAVTVSGDASEMTVSVLTMGQANEVHIVVNGTTKASLTDADDTYTIQGTPDESRHIQIFGDNGHRQVELQEFYV